MNLGMSMVLSVEELRIEDNHRLRNGNKAVVLPTILEDGSVEELREKTHKTIDKMFDAMEDSDNHIVVLS